MFGCDGKSTLSAQTHIHTGVSESEARQSQSVSDGRGRAYHVSVDVYGLIQTVDGLWNETEAGERRCYSHEEKKAWAEPFCVYYGKLKPLTFTFPL